MPPQSQSQKSAIAKTLAELWVMGEKFLIRPLQNEAIDMLNYCEKNIPTDAAHYIYEKTAKGCLLRAFIVGDSAVSSDLAKMRKNGDEYPVEMVADIALYLQPFMFNDISRGIMTSFQISDYYVG
jgi:hypothetical protein